MTTHSLSENQSVRKIANPLVGDELWFVELARETGGEHSLVEVLLRPGGGSARHFHKTIVERFETLAGTLGVQMGREERYLPAGEMLSVTPGTVHKYFNPGGADVRFRVRMTPGHAGFEQFLQIIYGLAADGRTTGSGMPRNPLHTGVLLTMSDTHLPGTIRILEPIARLLGSLGKWLGVEKALIQKYCQFT